jgi:hypothetical protein
MAEKELPPLTERLHQYAKNFGPSGDPDEPGYLAHDLIMAAEAIVNLGTEWVLSEHLRKRRANQ